MTGGTLCLQGGARYPRRRRDGPPLWLSGILPQMRRNTRPRRSDPAEALLWPDKIRNRAFLLLVEKLPARGNLARLETLCTLSAYPSKRN